MTILDISSINLDSYSSEEIVGYADKGLLSCCGVDLSELVEKLIEDRYSQEELDKACEAAYSDGQYEGCNCEVE